MTIGGSNPGQPVLISEQTNTITATSAPENGTDVLKSISISGGSFTSAEGKDNLDIPPEAFESGASGNSKNFVSGGNFSEPVAPDYLDTDATYGFYGISSNGTPVYGYYTEEDKALAGAIAANPNETPVVNTINPSSPDEGPSYSNKDSLIAMTVTPETMVYYNTGNKVEQAQTTGIEILSSGSQQIAANALDWSVEGLPGTGAGSGPSFTTNTSSTYWKYQTIDGISYLTLTSQDGGWMIRQLYDNSNKTTPYGEIELVYLGGNSTLPSYQSGIYTLTGTIPQSPKYNTNYIGNNNQVSVRYTINPTNVTDVQILGPNNQPITGTYTVDLNTTHTVDFGYLASNDQGPTTGHVVVWSLTCPSNTNGSSMPYATVNKDTGVVTFFRSLPANTILILSVTVDGQQSNQVILQTTGELNYDETTGIVPIYNPVNFSTANNNYLILNENVVTTPLEMPISSGSLTFTSSNPNFMVYQSATSTTGPNTYALIPMSGGGTGTTTITATWTNNNQTYSTTFDVNYVSSNVNATGVSAADKLTFTMTSPVSQNVDASLTPENNTVQAANLTNDSNGYINGYKYSSSNTAVAVVDQFGNVSPVGAGTCTITTTAVTGNGITSANNTATTTVTVDEQAPEAATITLDPTTVYLVPTGTEGTTSEEITATVTPDNVDPDSVVWSTSSADIAISTTNGLTTTVSSTDKAGTYTVTATVPGPDGSDITASATVIVSDQPLVIDPLKTSITADSPDFYTVTVAPTYNSALQVTPTDREVQKVSIFTWSQVGQTDLDCKVANRNADGTFSYTFPVNNTPVNEYYIDASGITVQAYASYDAGSDGNMVLNTTWNYADCGWEDGVIATAYVQNEGFVKPSVGNGAVAGTTGQALQMEGIRLSTPIEGVDVVYDVHVQNIGWMDQVEEGVYAGTMHENLQIEAVHIKLTGPNASQYTVQYQAHVENIGWQNWVSDGAEAGTTGQSLQLEALRISIVPAGTALPNN